MNVWGAQIHPPSLDRALAAWLLNAGLVGRAERRLFEGAVARGQLVLDVGPNQGVFTLLSLNGPSFPVEVMPLDDILPIEQVSLGSAWSWANVPAVRT